MILIKHYHCENAIWVSGKVIGECWHTDQICTVCNSIVFVDICVSILVNVSISDNIVLILGITEKY